MKFLVWIPDMGDEIKDARIINASNAKTAAEYVMKQQWNSMNHVDYLQIFVQDKDGVVSCYDVYARQIMDFKAYEAENDN